MATWKDGPRYAPLERPVGFAKPESGEPLSEIGQTPSIPSLPSTPLEPPAGFQAGPPGVPLDAIIPQPDDPRDPLQPFSVARAALTSIGDVVEEAVAVLAPPRSPHQPFQVDSGSLAPAYTPPVPVPPRAPVTLSACMTAAYPPLLILLTVLGLVALMNPLFAVVLLICVPILLASKVRFRTRQLMIVSFVVLGVLALVWIVSALINASTLNVDLMMNWWVFLGCWLLAATDIFLQWLGLSRQETPYSPVN